MRNQHAKMSTPNVRRLSCLTLASLTQCLSEISSTDTFSPDRTCPALNGFSRNEQGLRSAFQVLKLTGRRVLRMHSSLLTEVNLKVTGVTTVPFDRPRLPVRSPLGALPPFPALFQGVKPPNVGSE